MPGTSRRVPLVAQAQDAGERLSVFLRLGPRVGDGSDDKAPYFVSNNREGSRRRRDNGRHEGELPSDRPERSQNRTEGSRRQRGGAAPKSSLLQRTLTDVMRERDAEAAAVSSSSAAAPAPSVSASVRASDTAALELEAAREQLRRLEQERMAAQELADALLHSQQALLQEKAKVQREKSALEMDKAMLLEQIEFLTLTTEPAGGLPYHVDPLHEAEYERQLPITPDSDVVLHALRQHGGGPGGAEAAATDGVATQLRLDD